MDDSTLLLWQASLKEVARPEKIKILSSFFKTGKGEYGEGDIFLGISVPDNRNIAKRYAKAPHPTIIKMLESPVHEFRLSALLSMVDSYKHTQNEADRQKIISLYLKNCHKCNNWDLVDLSAPYLLGMEISKGQHLEDLKNLSLSQNLWHRRIAVVSTLTPIRKMQLSLAVEQCEMHITDSEPLMQKAVGWVLRETGKKSEEVLIKFLERHISDISATTLSYATEKLDIEQRRKWQQMRKENRKIIKK